MRVNLSTVVHFLALGAIFAISLTAFLRFEGSAVMQLYTVVMAVVAYTGWGMIYHFLSRRLTLSIILEYLLVGALVILLFFWTLFS